MIQSVSQRKKKQKDFFGTIGIVFVLVLVGGGYYFLKSIDDPLDEFMCSIKNGPKAVTAIIFDKSQMYTADQVTDIKTSFNLWLKGEEAKTKNRPIDLGVFKVGNLVQLYVADEKKLNKPEGLKPLAQLCVPKDFREANALAFNTETNESNSMSCSNSNFSSRVNRSSLFFSVR